jgi:hypothetical protein
MRRSIRRTRWYDVTLGLTWAAAFALALGVILEVGDNPRREHTLAPQPPAANPGGLTIGIRSAGNSAPAPGVRQFSTSDMLNMLLPLGLVPADLRQDRAFPLRNEDVARFFPDQAAAHQAMTAAGRVEGAGVDYQVPGQVSSSVTALVISSSAAW